MTPWKKDSYPKTKDYKNIVKPKKRKRSKRVNNCCGGQGPSNEELRDIWEKNYSLINLLQDKNISSQQRKHILQTLNKNQVKGICCLIHDTIYSQRNLKLTAEEAKKMKKDKELIKALTNKKISIDRKKQFFGSTKGGSILGLLLPLATLVAEPLVKLISKSINKHHTRR